MYIDARKFDYGAFEYPEAERLVERDKAFAQKAYEKWIKQNAGEIVERQWEIEDIGAVEQTGEFVKLLKEAEFTSALGAYTSAIALVGICAEDLCRFFAGSAGHDLDSLRQARRIDRLREMGAINRDIADKFHAIRRLRNSCLHYNDGFKEREAAELKADALEALNTIKVVYAEIVGVVDYKTVEISRFFDIVSTITQEAAGTSPGTLGVDDSVARTRILFANVFGIDLSLGDSGRLSYSTSIFKVLEIDFACEPPELTLGDLTGAGLCVIVDLTPAEALAVERSGIAAGDIVAASLMSMPNTLGMTGQWRLWSSVRKLAGSDA